MTLKETAMLMTILESAYPRFYKDQTEDERKNALKVWQDFFKDDDSRLVAAAMKALIASDEEGFPPTIGKLKARLRLITEPPKMTEMEVWALVSRAASRGMYHSKEEFSKLPPLAQRIVSSPNTLVEWGMLDASTFQTVTQSNFLRSYRALAQKQEAYDALPDDVRRIAGNISKQLSAGLSGHWTDEWTEDE